MSTFSTERMVTAAKPHRCGECWRAIDKDETYQRAAGNWEGSFWAMKTCAHCAAFRKIIDDIDTEFWEGMYGGISSWVSDGASDDLIGYGPWPWEERMAIFRLCHQYQSHWRDKTGALLPVPEQKGEEA